MASAEKRLQECCCHKNSDPTLQQLNRFGDEKMERHVLVLDYSTTFGRAVLAHYNGERLQLEDVHRFENEPVRIGDTIFWDIYVYCTS